MNLAAKDIQHNLGRFALTVFGIGMLLMIVMGMGGIYRGLVEDATLLVERIGADLWVVQRDTRGPFAEVSRVPKTLVYRVLAVPGVESAREFVFHTIQREHNGKPLRMSVLGLSWPLDKGEWLPLDRRQALGAEPLRNDCRQDAGTAAPRANQVGQGNVHDRRNHQRHGQHRRRRHGLRHRMGLAGDSVRYSRRGHASGTGSRERRSRTEDIFLSQPILTEQLSRPTAELPAVASPELSAVVVRVAPGADPDAVAATISTWGDVSVFTKAGQEELLLKGMVDKSRRQLGMFRTLLTIIAAIIMALILYTLTLDKLHSIALLKLIGAPNRTILGLILQQAIVLGGVGYGIAYLVGQKLFPYFPRRVVLTNEDLLQLAAIVLGISVLSSFLGIWKAMRVEPNEALMG